MPCKKSKSARSSAKKSKNTKEAVQVEVGLHNYIIRTRRQSQNEQQQKMAEITQPCPTNSSSSTLMPSIKENASITQAINEKENANIMSDSVNNTELLHPLNIEVGAQSTDDSAPISSNMSKVKGKVADIVERINNTPNSSPLPSPTATAISSHLLENMSTMEQQELFKSQTTSHACCQHDLSAVIHDLSETTKQLNSTVTRLQQELSGLRAQKDEQESKVSNLVQSHNEDKSRIDGILRVIADHEQRFQSMVGIMTKQDEEIKGLKRALQGMVAKSWRQNLIVSGVIERNGENPKWAVLEFFKKDMKIQDSIEVLKAHRIGSGNERPILVELGKIEDKAKIYQHVSNLKGHKNAKGKTFFISDQLPDAFAEKRRQESFIKFLNSKLPVAQQMDLSFKKGDLYVNSEKYSAPIAAPSIKQQIMPTTEEKKQINAIEILEGDTRDLHNSQFVGYAANVKTMDQVNGAYMAVRKIHPDATHVMCAFRFPGYNPLKSYGMADDGEHGGARRILDVLHKEKVYNCAAFVVRYYGGTNLGPDRFKIIEAVSSSAIAEVVHSQRPRSVPWNNAEESSTQWGDSRESQDGSEFGSAPSLPNEGRASMLNPDYLRPRSGQSPLVQPSTPDDATSQQSSQQG